MHFPQNHYCSNCKDPIQQKALLARPKNNQIAYNLKYEDLTKPMQGPLNPFNRNNYEKRNTLTGYAEQHELSETAFRTQHRTFQSFGYAQDPAQMSGTQKQMIGDLRSAEEHQNATVLDIKPSKATNKAIKASREGRGDSSIIDGENSYKGPWARFKLDKRLEDASEEEEIEDELLEEEEESGSTEPLQPEPLYELEIGTSKEKTEFHADSTVDWQGRSRILHVPQDLDVNLNKVPGEQECFLPKKIIHTWEAHNKGILALRLFPHSGHMILSGGMDSTIKIWDMYHERQLMRTYLGHSKSIKDLCFSNDGTKFLSSSFDKMMKLWDTETGACLARFTSGKVANAIKFNPNEDKQNEFLAATSDKKILQFDLRTQDAVQEYDHHLAAVNTITFIDQNRRFLTTSDDKSLRAWDYGINVPIKIIHEPYMNSMVSVVSHPSDRYVAAQGVDNQISVFSTHDKIRQNQRKGFKGHTCGGFQIQLDFSPDGKYLMSGDAGGMACFWDWKTTKLYKKMKVHESALVCIQAHPQETSKVVTASWDGKSTLLIYKRLTSITGTMKLLD